LCATTSSLCPFKVALLHYNYVQPWHPQSAVMHEVALAVELVDPSKYNAFAGSFLLPGRNDGICCLGLSTSTLVPRLLR
jgi:hypothetical protein